MRGLPRSPARRTAVLVAVPLAAFAVLALVLHPRWLRAGHFLEVIAYGCLASFLVGHRPFREIIDQLGGRGRAVVLGFCGVLLVGQMFGGGRHVFPLVRFAMFTDRVSEPDGTTYYRATFEDGSERVLQPREMLPPGGEGRFEGMAKQQLAKLQPPPPPGGAWAETTYGRAIGGLLASHNALHPEHRILRLEVSACCTDLHLEGPRPSAQRTPLFTLEADAAH